MTRILRVDSAEQLFEHAAAMIEKSIRVLLSTQKLVLLGVPGGRSVAGIFAKLLKKRIKWKRVHIFMVDERLVPINHEESNFRLVRDNLTKELTEKNILPKENVHPFVYDETQADYGISAYEKELQKYSDKYDIILLSSGDDGHIGGLYPNHHSIKDDAELFLAMDDSPKPPADRMSMSRKHVLKSQIVIAVFMGSTKRDALNMFRSMRYDFLSCPVKLIHDIRNSYVITDIMEEKR